jgi:hypothetical protein
LLYLYLFITQVIKQLQVMFCVASV